MIHQPSRARLRAFWNRRQLGAAERPWSGYLSDESPPRIGRARFEGEWRRFLDFHARWCSGSGACLDLGCGAGDWSLAFSELYKNVDAIDWADSMIQAAKKNASARKIKNISFRRSEVTQIRGSAKYDLIFVGGVLMYCRDDMLDPFFNAVTRLLKPGGLLILRESVSRENSFSREGGPLKPGISSDNAGGGNYAAVYRAARNYRDALNQHGFEIMETRPNRHYKFTDLVEKRLALLNRLLGGRLRQDAALADRWAKRLLDHAWLTLWPEYAARKVLGGAGWSLQNYWFVSRQKSLV